jgi:hypothetical protein
LKHATETISSSTSRTWWIAARESFVSRMFSKHRLPDVAFVPSLVRDSVDWIKLLVLDAAAEMDATDRSELEASIERGLNQADRYDLLTVEDVLARLKPI